MANINVWERKEIDKYIASGGRVVRITREMADRLTADENRHVNKLSRSLHAKRTRKRKPGKM